MNIDEYSDVYKMKYSQFCKYLQHKYSPPQKAYFNDKFDTITSYQRKAVSYRKMSWEYDIRKIKCPCGNGFISQESRSDDWGRTENYVPTIECPECSQKYKIETEQHFCYKWDGDGISYYITPKDYPEYAGITEDAQFPSATLNVLDFAEWFTERYTKAQLQSSLAEFQENKSSSKVSLELSKELVKEHKLKYRNAKVSEIIPHLQEIIDGYDSYFGNFEQRKPIRDEEMRERKIYTDEKRKHQIGLQELYNYTDKVD